MWKDVGGYEGIYEVSSEGQVRTHASRATYRKRYDKYTYAQRTLTTQVRSSKICHVRLYKEGLGRTFLVHRLVAIAFIPTEEGRVFVNHIDGNRLNNDVNNLEWCTNAENMNHAYETGLQSRNIKIELRNKSTGESHEFRSMAKASEFLGRDRGTLSRYCKDGVSSVDGYEIHREESGASGT
jgi:hypothetical protein